MQFATIICALAATAAAQDLSGIFASASAELTSIKPSLTDAAQSSAYTLLLSALSSESRAAQTDPALSSEIISAYNSATSASSFGLGGLTVTPTGSSAVSSLTGATMTTQTTSAVAAGSTSSASVATSSYKAGAADGARVGAMGVVGGAFLGFAMML